MTEEDLRNIESRLGIGLPRVYRAMHLENVDSLLRLDWGTEVLNPLYLTAEQLIVPNLEERKPDMGTACAFPRWWDTFVMVGTNGGGDYYCLRLDHSDGVWLIGSDCDRTPTQVAATLADFVETIIAEHESAKAIAAERARRHAPFEPEIRAHLDAIRREHGSELAQNWMTCNAIYPMFEWLNGLEPKVSPRKMRLYGLALCQLIPNLDDDADWVEGMAVAKAVTVGKVTEPQFAAMRSLLSQKIKQLSDQYVTFDPDSYKFMLWRTKAVYNLFQADDDYLTDPAGPDDPDLTRVYQAPGYAIADYPYGVEQAPDLLREVLGNPFHRVACIPEWRTPQTTRMARTIFDEERFEDLPKLAMALAEAGCDDARILAHCNRPGEHVRGCWVVDLLLDDKDKK